MSACPTCGGPSKKRRSPEHHKRFFAVIAAAYQHWPESHDFQPANAEHLRAWLLCKAKWCNVQTGTVDSFISGSHKTEAGFSFRFRAGTLVHEYRPKSINWEKMDQRTFSPIAQAVDEIIEAEIGVPTDRLLRETEAAA